MRTAIYARVSTQDQTVAPQLDVLREYAHRRGWEAVEYIDEAISGAKVSRPALDQMMADARRREFDALAVVKLDRLARSVRHLTEMAAELEALGVDLVVLDQGIDTGTPSGRLLFHVLASIAEFERDLIRERTRAGLAAAKRRGQQLGRPRVMDTDKRARLKRLHGLGHSQRSIASLIGVSNGTVAGEVKRLSLAASV